MTVYNLGVRRAIMRIEQSGSVQTQTASAHEKNIIKNGIKTTSKSVKPRIKRTAVCAGIQTKHTATARINRVQSKTSSVGWRSKTAIILWRSNNGKPFAKSISIVVCVAVSKRPWRLTTLFHFRVAEIIQLVTCNLYAGCVMAKKQPRLSIIDSEGWVFPPLFCFDDTPSS